MTLMEKPDVIVLGRNYSTPLGIIRSLGKEGYHVDMLYITAGKDAVKIVEASKYIRKTVIVSGREDEKVIKALLEQKKDNGEKCVLFPSDDFSCLCIDRNRGILKEHFILPYTAENSISFYMDKTEQSRLAAEAGLKTAEEWVISLREDIVSIPEGIKYPCFVKPLVSAKGGKSELRKCGSRKELVDRLNKMQESSRDRSVLVQEYLNIITEYTMDGVCKDQDILLPGIIKKNVIARHNRGVTLCGTMVKPDEIADSLPAIFRFLKSVRFTGMFDMEMLLTDKGLYFGELNMRFGGPSYAYTRCGVNLPTVTVRALCSNDELPQENGMVFGRTFVNNKVAWEDYADAFLTGKGLNKLLDSCDFTLLSDEEDPEPEKLFTEIQVPVYRKSEKRNIAKKHVKSLLSFVKAGKNE
ncbi:MAG: hypothetical protein K6F23_15680 [Solobacterium sp.]|nr:hypothetical protein [Solobacterium sp.]